MLGKIMDRWRIADGAATLASWLWRLFLLVTGLSAGTVMGWAVSQSQITSRPPLTKGRILAALRRSPLVGADLDLRRQR
jgi:hypothetical protein